MAKPFSYLLFVVPFTLLSSLAMAGSDTGGGCGVGSQIWTKNTVISQTLAAGTNQMFSQNSSITSSTSGCKSSGFVKEDKKEIYYAEANYEALSIEMARGEGESLSAFAQLLGCSDQGTHALAKMTKNKYQTLFPEGASNPDDLVKSVQKEIHQDRFLSENCSTARI